MKKLLHQMLLLALAVAAVPVWASQRVAGLAAAFGTPPQQSDFVLSPDGRLVAWRQQSGANAEVVIYDLKTHSVRRTFSAGKSWPLYWLGWEDDDTLLIETGATKRMPADWPGGLQNQPVNWTRELALDVSSGKGHVLLADRLATASLIDTRAQLIAYDIPQPHTVIMAAMQQDASDYRERAGTMIHDPVADSGNVSTLFSVDTRTGEGKPIATGDAFTSQWWVDEAGEPVARSEWHAADQRYSIYALQGGKWRWIYQHTGAEPVVPGLDPQTHAILAIIQGSGGTRRLWAIPLDGSAPTRMWPAVRRQVRSIVFSRFSDTPTAVWVGGAHPHRTWLNTAAQARYESVARAFPGREVHVYDHTRDGKAVLAEVEGSGSPPVYYLINFATGHAMIAGAAYPQLAHVPLGAVQAIQYPTRGHIVHAQLFLPPGGGKNLSLAVLVPGGPVGDDHGAFDWFAQYLAASGYAVLRPDIALRGLVGSQRGWILWGGHSQRYAIDGVHALVRQGVVDPRHVCIVGVGYGGYAALAGAAFSPSTYACAVSIDGISDLNSLLDYETVLFSGMHTSPAALATMRAYLKSSGDPKTGAASPVQAARAVKAPVLLIHDEQDTLVPIQQSLEMWHALRKLGKPVTFIKLAGADPMLSHGSTRIKVLKAVGGFLARYLH